jgi:probable biosynthetic protein (TIGR04098 family)
MSRPPAKQAERLVREMLLETIELTMSHVGLGNLTEYALLVLFGNSHSHYLTMGTGITPDKIIDEAGRLLYPAYYKTHLKVPVEAVLSGYKLWEEVQIGVDVQRFGANLLESTYIFGRKGEIPGRPEEWNPERFPSMKGNNLLLVDVTEADQEDNRTFSSPKIGYMADIEKAKRPPAAIQQANSVKSDGFANIKSTIKNESPVIFNVVSGRDASPGHAMIFAKFSEIMDYGEMMFLAAENTGFSLELWRQLELLEREVFYYANCFAGETLEIYLTGGIEAIAEDFNRKLPDGRLPKAYLFFQVDIYKQKNHLLLAKARVKKLLAVPPGSTELMEKADKLVFHCSTG